MSGLVAIHPDDYTAGTVPPGGDASSPFWASLLESAGFEIRWVDVYRADILSQIDGCDALMWRWAHWGGMHQIARRLLPVAEQLGLVVYPDYRTWWHYDDKISQAYLLHALGIPSPNTFVFFTELEALEWLRQTSFPVVFKLFAGASSANVRLVRDQHEGHTWVRRLFGPGVTNPVPSDGVPLRRWPWKIRAKVAARAILKGLHPVPERGRYEEIHRDYALFQEFLPNNDFDTRITVIGDQAYAFRRWNREGDFRASGSGDIDYDPDPIDFRFVELGFRVADATGSQSCAVDGLYRDGEPVIAEISYTYNTWCLHQCPGHFVRERQNGAITWREGQVRPEVAQVDGVVERLRARARARST